MANDISSNQSSTSTPTIKEPLPVRVKHPEIVRVKNFSFFYNKGKNRILYNINLKIKEKYVTTFIGSSGSGKSTLLRSINRMNDLIPGYVYQGEILVFNKNIFAPNVDVPELRSQVGMVFQQPNPFPMSIYDNVVYGPKLQGIRDKKILDQIAEDSLKRAALWDEVQGMLNSPALGLSGGQQQRLCIARAIAMHPKILLMDEPTSALDPIATLKIEELILELKRDYTIILVSHSMQEVTRVGDMTAFFLAGHLIEYGWTKKIFTNPRDRRTEDFISGRYE